MRRRSVLRWGLFASGMIMGGAVTAQQLSPGEIAAGAFPLLDLQDFSQPLPQHWITKTDAFYIQSYSGTPQVNAATWSLTLDGLVDRPQSLTLQQIQALPAEEFYWTLECIGNPAGGELIGNALWKGTRLYPLLQEVGIKPEAQAFALHAADDYLTGVLLQDLLHQEVWLAYQMNGEPLPPHHGYPLRILIPGKYGQKQPKWLTRIEAISELNRGYWEKQGWSNEANILTQALPRQMQKQRVSQKASRLTLPAGRISLAGVALASGKPIQSILVSADAGETWHEAERNQPGTPYEWTLWRYAWDLQAGTHVLMAQAATGPDDVQRLQDLGGLDGTNSVLQIKVRLT